MNELPYKVEKQYVIPESELDRIAHVYRDPRSGKLYNTTLNCIDIKENINSYFKMQILESDRLEMYWLFRTWGRIGGKMEGKETCGFIKIEEAIESFESVFFTMTGNRWKGQFYEIPGKYYMVEIEKYSTPSKLPPEVQQLMKLIFNINAMKQAMADAKIDTTKMPLGRLSKKQLDEGYACLNDIQTLITNGADRSQLIEVSNSFFKLVPHNSAQVIDTIAEVRKKRELIESLLQIVIAYSMMKDSEDRANSTIDNNYDQLRADIFPLGKDTSDFQMIRRYVENTQGATHCYFKLELLEVFRIGRQGEKRRFRQWKKLHNRQLLWHGSRTTNFAGILSNGLKIAPPEAPSTGWMFGKGIYFADCVSKSANYCKVIENRSDVGLILLSEVALGDMEEHYQAPAPGTVLARGRHSVKGVGLYQPNPKDTFIREDGTIVPYGKLKKTKNNSALYYNEYIVYNPDQVNIQYLVKLKFNYIRY